MSQHFSKLQANAPPKPPDVATGLVPASVQPGSNGVLSLPIHLVGQKRVGHGILLAMAGRVCREDRRFHLSNLSRWISNGS